MEAPTSPSQLISAMARVPAISELSLVVPGTAGSRLGDKTAWRLFNAVTFTLTGHVAENPTATTKLHKVIDEVFQTIN